MRKTIISLALVLTGSPMYADAITDGISTAGDAVYGYTSYVQALGFVLACVIGIAGAFAVYYAIVNNEQKVRKRILSWGGACVAMLCMTIALPKFFDYQEGASNNGALADAGTFIGDGIGRHVGGDRYGLINTEIPDLSDPRWQRDPIYDRWIFPPRRRYLGEE